MTEILNGKEVIKKDVTAGAMGGTELMAHAMVKHIDPELLKKFHVIHSRWRGEDASSNRRILVVHDLPGDPEFEHLRNGGWNRFEKLVFVSNWQMYNFIMYYGIPWYKCVVIRNAIEIENSVLPSKWNISDDSIINLVYHTTPHRGLDILVSIFDDLIKLHPRVRLDVFSSFKLYGWEERDAQFKSLFDYCSNHDAITYHGVASNAVVREHLLNKAHIFAYPSIWQETSCIALIESMADWCFSVHPNFGALAETSSNVTEMYQWNANKRDHGAAFLDKLDRTIQKIRSGDVPAAPAYVANKAFSWNARKIEWNDFLKALG